MTGRWFPPDAERNEILSEQVEIVHRLWDRDEGEVTFEGDLEDSLAGLFQLARSVEARLPRLVPASSPFDRGVSGVLDALRLGLLAGPAKRERLAASAPANE